MRRVNLVFLLSFACLMSQAVEGRTLDRLILEINGQAFSQRQIEIYQAIRSIAMDTSIARALPHSDHWLKNLEIFSNENMVYLTLENDVQKMAVLQPDSKKIRRVQVRLEALQGDNKWRDFLRNYQINEREIVSILIRVFQIQEYLQTLVKQSASDQVGQGIFLQIDSAAEWFKLFMQGSTVRFYDKAREYQQIQPYGGG